MLCTGYPCVVIRRPLLRPRWGQQPGPMTIPDDVTVTREVQCARSILAELAEMGPVLSRERHIDVLLALDSLELAAKGFWPPPNAARNITDVSRALTEARDALAAVLADLSVHDVDPVRVALARDHVATALTRTS